MNLGASAVCFEDLIANMDSSVICAERGFGKSRLAMQIVDSLLDEGRTVITIDSSQVWLWNYPRLPYTLVREGKARRMQNFPVESRLYDVSLARGNKREFTANLVQALFDFSAEETYRNQGIAPRRITVVIEESSVLLGRGLTEALLELCAVSRNFGVNYLLTSQRLVWMTDAIERATAYWIGRLKGTNNLAKISRLVGKSYSEMVPTLKKGTWLYYDGQARLVRVPMYLSTHRRQLNRGFWARLLGRGQNKPRITQVPIDLPSGQMEQTRPCIKPL